MKSTYIYFTDQEIAESVEHFKGELTKVTQRLELVKGLVEKLKLEESPEEPVLPKEETKVQPKAKKTVTKKAKIESKTKVKVKTKAVKPKSSKPKKETPALETPKPEAITNKVPEADTKYQTQTPKETGTPVEKRPTYKTQTTDDAPKTKTRVEEVEVEEVDLPLVEKEIADTVEVDQKEELDSFLLKTLKTEIRFFSFDSLVALSCKRYDVSGEFQVEDMAKKVRKNLTKLGKKGLIMIKRPREGKRFLYKIN